MERCLYKCFLVAVVATVLYFPDVSCTSTTPLTSFPENVTSAYRTSKLQYAVGPFLKVLPVRVRSDKGEPLLAFYMKSSTLKPRIEVLMDSDFTTSFDFSIICLNRNITMMLKVLAYPVNNLRVRGDHLFPVPCKDAVESNLQDVYSTPRPAEHQNITLPSWTVYVTQGRFDVGLRSGIIGIGIVEFSLVTVHRGPVNVSSNEDTHPEHHSYSTNKTGFTFVIADPAESNKTLTYTINVIREIRPVDKIFRLVIYCVQVFVATGFGCKLDLGVVKANLLRPIAPGIGLACQYILMPLIAFTVAKLVPVGIPAVSLGIFVAGCCPGGGASNMYSLLLRGDLSLSITMTALSTVLALAMLPFWLYTLGTQFSETGELNIPFEMVAVSLSILILPLLIGLFLRHKFPKIAKKLGKILKPVILVIVIILVCVGIYSNMYIFRLFKPRVILAGLLLPYVGYVSGGLVAFILRQPWTQVKTIALETGMQNTSIGFILLIHSFPAPYGDIAAIGPVASALMTPLPPLVITIFYLLYRKFCKKDDVEDEEEGKESVENGTAGKEGEQEKLTSEMTQTDDGGITEEKIALTVV